MRKYDVHVYAQIRFKVVGVEAENPVAAINIVTNDQKIDAEVHRMVDVEGAIGRVADISYQGESVAEGYLVDPLDENEHGHGDGISFDVDESGDPILAYDTQKMPNVHQKMFAEQRSHAIHHRDARGAAKTIARDSAFDAGLFAALDAAEDPAATDDLLAHFEKRIADLRHAIQQTSVREDDRIPLGVAEAVEPAGLRAVFVPAEDRSVDDSIEIRRASDNEEMADIQICQDDTYGVGMWTDDTKTARHMDGFFDEPAAAAKEAVRLLKQRGRI